MIPKYFGPIPKMDPPGKSGAAFTGPVKNLSTPKKKGKS